MALKPCPECRKQVSTQATSCPNCGAPISEAAQKAVFMEKLYREMGLAGKPRCPRCGLPNLEPIGIADRLASGFIGTVSPVTSNPASRGHFKTSHAEKSSFNGLGG